MAVAPRQCIHSHGPISQAAAKQPFYSPDLAPCDFLFYFVQLNLVEREPILPQLKRFRHKNGKSCKGTSKTLVPELLPAMATSNAEVRDY
ncbi:hypothetical protein TNCV_1611561 [Trichonephila clavipes]|nr:hypothetical protein TNCV_1611561 [Trichonephila clavipes]